MSVEEVNWKIENALRREAIEQGLKEKSIEIAKKKLKDDITVEQISKYTSLSKEKIESLKWKQANFACFFFQ